MDKSARARGADEAPSRPIAVTGRDRRESEYRARARVGLAAAYVLIGVAFFVLTPFIGTTRVPSELFSVVLLMWVLGLMVLPALGHRSAMRLVLGSSIAVATFVVVATVVSGGLSSPFGY